MGVITSEQRAVWVEYILDVLGRPEPGWLGAVVAAKMPVVDCDAAEFLVLAQADNGPGGVLIAGMVADGPRYRVRLMWPERVEKQAELL